MTKLRTVRPTMRLKFWTLAAVLLWGSVPASAAYVNVYGGPSYTSGVGGFKDGYVTGVNDAGTAIGAVYMFDAFDTDLGERAFRWDGSGAAATELENLGTDLDGVTHSIASAINDAGTVVGSTEKYDGAGESLGSRAVRWNASGASATELGHLGTDSNDFTYSWANAINNAGTIVGGAEVYDGSDEDLGNRAVRWAAASNVATQLENLGTETSDLAYSNVYAINTAGTAVGYSEIYDGLGEYLGLRAVRWAAMSTVATELENLGTETGDLTYSNAINDAGTVIGYTYKFGGSGEDLGTHAVRWDTSSTVATELGNLGADANGVSHGYAFAISDAGTAVGYSDIYNGLGEYLGHRAVRWDASSALATELENLGLDSTDVTHSSAYAINAAGITVGYAAKYDGSGEPLGESAVYWGLDGAAVDLNSLIDPASGWTLESADAISDTGWIAGSGAFDPDGPGGQDPYGRLFLLQLVPAITGDYNENGTVDAADYTVWRDALTAGSTTLPNDPTPGTVDESDFLYWRDNFGAVLDGGAGSVAAIPEPSTAFLLCAGATGLTALRRWPRQC